MLFPLEGFSCCKVSPLHREYREKLDYFLTASFSCTWGLLPSPCSGSSSPAFPCRWYFPEFSCFILLSPVPPLIQPLCSWSIPRICLAGEALRVPIFSRVLFQRPYWCLLCFSIKNMACICLFCNSRICLIHPTFDLLETKITLPT